MKLELRNQIVAEYSATVWYSAYLAMFLLLDRILINYWALLVKVRDSTNNTFSIKLNTEFGKVMSQMPTIRGIFGMKRKIIKIDGNSTFFLIIR